MTLFSSIKRFIKKQIPGIRILAYHRVAEVNNDPELLCVTPNHFVEQVEVLRKKYEVVDLEEQVLNGKQLRHINKCIVITFDDGYADNLYQMKPILEKYELPATIFITTGQLGLKQEFWWDDLARIILIHPHLPSELRLIIKGSDYFWNIQNDQTIGPSKLSWNVLAKANPDQRQKTYLEIANLLKTCGRDERFDIMNSIHLWAGLDSNGRADYRVMDANELGLLADGGLINIGSHTNSHVSLASMHEDVQFTELRESKRILEEILNKRISTFSYPFGSKDDYSSVTIKILKKLGYQLACADYPGKVNWRTDRFQLPRFLVRDWDGDTFGHWISTQ
jgi:peptidoglycan/xylan/chitin deacetylase (PgdA/CDA1 family)